MRQSRRSFLDVLAGGRSDASYDTGLWIAARGHEETQAQADRPHRAGASAGQTGAASRRQGHPHQQQRESARPRQGGARRNHAASSPRPGDTRSTARRPTARSSPTIATKFGAKPENVVLGAGSQEILKTAIRAFTSPIRGLVTAAPSFENCPQLAKRLGHPVTEVKVDAALRLDLEAMAAARQGRGPRVPEQPEQPDGDGARQQGGRRLRAAACGAASPDTVILIDEAYHDYVTDPSYESAIPLALQTPNVFVARTFSKAYGMAGLRIGYAHRPGAPRSSRWRS